MERERWWPFPYFLLLHSHHLHGQNCRRHHHLPPPPSSPSLSPSSTTVVVSTSINPQIQQIEMDDDFSAAVDPSILDMLGKNLLSVISHVSICMLLVISLSLPSFTSTIIVSAATEFDIFINLMTDLSQKINFSHQQQKIGNPNLIGKQRGSRSEAVASTEEEVRKANTDDGAETKVVVGIRDLEGKKSESLRLHHHQMSSMASTSAATLAGKAALTTSSDEI